MDRSSAKDERAAGDWLTRPFARTFDLISKEYGWTDEQILDLTMARMRQIRDVIFTRLGEEFDRNTRMEEAKLRIMASAVHSAAGNASGVKSAAKITLVDREPAKKEPDELPPVEAVVASFGGGSPLYTEEEILAKAEEMKAAGLLEEPTGRWEVKGG